MVEVNDTKVLFLAIWLHETYESQAREVGWKTQESCRVKFDDLPEANKKVMLKIARDIVYNLEINKQEGRVEGAKTELQNCIKDLEASLEFYECDYGKFEQQVVDKVIEELTENINKFKKRLKNLESGKE